MERCFGKNQIETLWIGTNMSVRTRQILANTIVGGAILTAAAVVVPQMVASQPSPTVAVVPTVSVVAPISGEKTEVDMNHWQETAGPVTPYIPGKPRKGK